MRCRESWCNGGSDVPERRFCRRERVLVTRTKRKGKFQIESSRQSAERVLVRVVQDCVGRTLASVVPKHAVPVFPFANLPFLHSGHPSSSPAEQGARANDLRCHVSCDRRLHRRKSTDRSSYCCTSRASEGRGSSLTFGRRLRHPRDMRKLPERVRSRVA